MRTANLRHAYAQSVEISLVTALLGGLLGFLIAYAAIRDGTPNWIRSAFATFSGVAANFGGIPLAFAFVATLGTIGIVTQFLTNTFGYNLYEHGFTLFGKTGVELAYLYFQIPLMILVIAPAIDGVRQEWSEASSNLGASRLQFWRYIALPVLFPSLLGGVILLFGNAFAAYATAYALTSGTALPARADPHRFGLGRERVLEPTRGPGARVRHVRRAGRDDALLHPAPATRDPVGEVSRRRIAPSAVVWLLIGGVYFMLPLVATFLFSIKDANTGKCCSLSAYGFILHDPHFWRTIKLSFRLSLETIVVGLLLFVPTLYWVHLKLPKLRPVIGFMALVPFVVPPIILVVGPAPVLQAGRARPVLVPREAGLLPRRRVRHPRVPVHLLLARRGLSLDRRAHTDRGVTEPRRGLADDAHAA